MRPQTCSPVPPGPALAALLERRSELPQGALLIVAGERLAGLLEAQGLGRAAFRGTGTFRRLAACSM